MFKFFQSNAAAVERQSHILFRLILITFIVTTSLFAILKVTNNFNTEIFSLAVFGFLTVSQAVSLYLLNKKSYEPATILFSLTFGGCAIFLSLFLGNIMALLPFLHLLSVMPLLLMFGEKNGGAYLRSVILIHLLIAALRAFEVLPKPRIVFSPALMIPIMFALSLVFFAFIFLVVQALARVAFQATRNERKLGDAIGRLRVQNQKRQEMLTQLIQKERERDEAIDNNQLLEAKVRHKDAFLATVSHELRTPLNVMIGRSQALKMGIYGDLTTKQTETITGIETSGGHLLGLINDILDVAKITAGEMSIKFDSVNVRDLMEATILEICPLAEKKCIEIEQLFVIETTHIVADAGRLRQILINLLSNALKFTPQDKKIGLMVTENVAQNMIHFMVWDEGVGIPEAKQKGLFEPFIQVENKLSSESMGTGLGLALVKQLAELHHGTVTLKSEAGKGSSFTVSLPIEYVEEADVVETAVIQNRLYLMDDPIH